MEAGEIAPGENFAKPRSGFAEPIMGRGPGPAVRGWLFAA